MYLDFFSLKEYPFTLTPDTSYYFAYQSHQEAMNVLLVALRSGEGFLKVTGEVGTGKTLLCRTLLKQIHDPFVSVYLPNPFLTPTALRMAVAEELGIEFARNIGQHRLLKLITARLAGLARQGKKVVVLIDEAQALPDDTLESLRLLTNLETEKRKLIQVVLFGQPELDARLQQHRLRQLRQRISFSYHLTPLTCDAVGEYISHRLSVAGHTSTALFHKRALRTVHHASRGIPRLINILCHKSLLAAYGKGLHQVNNTLVQMAVLDTEDAHHGPGVRLRRVLLAGFALLATAGGVLFWHGGLS